MRANLCKKLAASTGLFAEFQHPDQRRRRQHTDAAASALAGYEMFERQTGVK
jgi:hypothetical protein